MTTFNRPVLLRESLASVQTQTVGDFECIVVDDAGSIPVELPPDDRFRLFRHDRNRGLPASLNTALEQARGRYVTFLDDDDLYTEDRLALALEGVARSDVAICWRANAVTNAVGRNRLLGDDAYEKILLRPIPLRGQTTVAREIVCPFDENLVTSSDLEWWLRITAVSGVSTVAKVGLLVRRHTGTRLSRNYVERVKARAYIFEKHSDYFAERPAATARFLRRMGWLAREAGDHATARTALWRSLRLRPQPRTAALLIRSFRPSTDGAVSRRGLAPVAPTDESGIENA